jgi:hypothetical protein
LVFIKNNSIFFKKNCQLAIKNLLLNFFWQ